MAQDNPDRKWLNIILTGFANSGKSTVGWIVADLMRWRFVSVEEEIESRFGKSREQVIEADGQDKFLRYESMICQSLTAQTNQVVATSAETLLNPANLTMMESTGLVICLHADADVIRERMSGGKGTQLEWGWEFEHEELAEQYAVIEHHIDTSHQTPQEVAKDVVSLWHSVSL
jgi:shikimate kinase